MVRTETWTAWVHEMLTKLWNKTEFCVVAYSHQGCHRTSNAVDRPMNRLCRLMYANRGLHGHQGWSELGLRGWALLLNFPDPTGLQVLKKCRVSGRRHFCHPTSFQGRGCENGRSTEDPASGS